MNELQALPGAAVPESEPTLYDWAKLLGMPSQRSSQPGFAAPAAPPPPSRARADAPPAITTTSTPQRGQDGTDSRADLPAVHPDKAEATSMLEAGLSARHVAEEFGLPLTTVATWAAEVRAKRQGRAA